MKLDKSFHIYTLYPITMNLKGVLFFMAFFIAGTLHAQQEAAPDFMRSIGKIYVVTAVVLVILLSIFVYLVILDRKISRLEKRHKNE